MNGDPTCRSSNSQFFVKEGDAVANFRGHTLLVPCVSVGNVGQLAVDLVVSTLGMQRVGWIQDTALLPLVGNDAFDHTRGRGYLHTSAEVYWKEDLKIVAVQIRSPIAKGCGQGFCQRLLRWVSEEQFSRVSVLTSSHAHERKDAQLSGSPYRFVLNSQSSADLMDHFTNRLKWLPLEQRTSISSSSDNNGKSEVFSSQSQYYLPGSGLARQLIAHSSEFGVPLVVLVKFCSQGDNIPDAVGLTSYLNEWLRMVSQTKEGSGRTAWRLLDSWQLMYGTPHPTELY